MNKNHENLDHVVSQPDERLIKNETLKFNIITVIEKLFLPAAVAILGFFIHNSALELTRSQENRTAIMAKTEIHLKTLDNFYHYISSPEPKKQFTALYLLTAVEPDVGQRLAYAVAINPEMPKRIRQEANKLAKNIKLVGSLINYQIVLYYPQENDQQKEQAINLQKSFFEYIPLMSVSTQAATNIQLEQWVLPKENEIRFDPIFEKDDAEKLQALLRELLPKKNFTLKPTSTTRHRTENILTVFIIN